MEGPYQSASYGTQQLTSLSANDQHYVGIIEALIAPTQLEEGAIPYDQQQHQALSSHQSTDSFLIDPQTGRPSQLRQPFQDIAAYSARAFLPSIPDHIQKTLQEHQTRLLTKNINWGAAKTIKDVRSVRVRGEGIMIKPKGGKRSLAEIEQINPEWLARAAYKWNDRRVPRCLNVFQLSKYRPDLFVSFNNGSFNLPVFNSAAVSFTIPALGFSTEDISATTSSYDTQMTGDDDDGYDTEPEEEGSGAAGPSSTQHATSLGTSSLGLRAQPSAFDSMADLNQSLSIVSRTISKAHISSPAVGPHTTLNRADDDNDDDDAASISSNPSSISISPNTASILSHLPELFKATMLTTVASLVHTSEPDKTVGWSWVDVQNAREHVQQHHHHHSHPRFNRPRKADAATLPSGWAAWIWARSPLKPCRQEQGDRRNLEDSHVLWRDDGGVGKTLLPRGVWLAGPGVKNEGYMVESRETKYGFSEFGMACFLVPPTLGLTEQDFIDMCQSQEFSDGARGERGFTPAEAGWATIHDICKELDVKFFSISTFSSMAFGAFSTSFESAFISPPVSTHAPTTNINPLRGPLMPALDMALGENVPRAAGDLQKTARRPNAIQHLAYWMRSGMGNCTEGWVIPSQVDGTAGWSGAMILHDNYAAPTAAGLTKEWMWPFLKFEAASEKALEDTREFVVEKILPKDPLAGAASRALTQTFTQIQVADMIFGSGSGSGSGPSQIKGGVKVRPRVPPFFGGAEYNSAMLEARHAQVAQRLDLEALHGGKGADEVPQIALTNELGEPLGRAWEELNREATAGEREVVGTGMAAFDWLRPTEDMPDVQVQPLRQVHQQQQLPTPIDTADDAGSNVGLLEAAVHADEDDGMAVEPKDVSAVLNSARLEIPNAVFIPSTSLGEPPLIRNSATGELYRIFGSNVVKVGDPRIVVDNMESFASTEPEDNDEVDESEVANLVTASASSSFSDRSSLTTLDDSEEPMTPSTGRNGPTPSRIGRSGKRKGKATDLNAVGPSSRPVRDSAPQWNVPHSAAKTPGKRLRAPKGDADVFEFAEPGPKVKKARMSKKRGVATAAPDNDSDDDDDMPMAGCSNRVQSSSEAPVTPGPRRVSARLSGGHDRPTKSLKSRR
ncbi:hypothetical protein FRB96_004418 [Tulasnella sp. 330]|nr:hypothetical protein FRB96_004418 [Tulasnella sp. 330]KAG8884513.1 hypothetical protein FRB97_004026 [Tulasnella sp. 331]